MTHRLGIDVGGTFTDFAWIDDRTRIVATEKLLTTPDDPSRAVIEGVGDFVDSAVYDRYALRPGMRFDGPALIEDR